MAQTIFITGSSTGLGRAAALLFARKGWQVFATMRDPSKEKELQSVPGVRLLALDVTQPAQVSAAAKKALESGPLDVLFNNAGYGLAGPFEAATDAQLTQEIDTNLLGVMRVTQAFLPAMRERASGCIITTTSIGGLVTFPFNSVYHATKWGLEGWSESLAFELAGFGIKVKTVAPGGIRTDFATRSLVLTQHSAYAAGIAKTMKTFMDPKRREKGSSAEQIADVVYEAATDNKDQVTYVAGADANETYAQRLAVGAEKFRRAIRELFLG
jgi:NAD(P)-dependent dehydrogenase (short-subunit alcohol dehydrogenase family)